VCQVLGFTAASKGELSRFGDDKRKPEQEKVASSEKDAERKTCQRERVPRDDAANGRDNQAVRLHSYRLSLLFTGVPHHSPLSKLPSPDLP